MSYNYSTASSSDEESDDPHIKDEGEEGDHASFKRPYSESQTDDDNEEVTEKRTKLSFQGNYSNQAMKMMQSMGYKQNEGLGRLGQGIKAPIQASQQKGRRGLGTKFENIDRSAMKFETNSEQIQIPETVQWLENPHDDLHDLDRDKLDMWIGRGPEKLIIDDEDNFIEPKLLQDILEAKTAFDELGADDMQKARARCNPFETIRSSIFLNRAAVKMANIDSLLDYMFTNPLSPSGEKLVKDDELLYFADVCAGPGGFSEYVLWRRKWHAKGFGFTLKGKCDFDLTKFLVGSPETFDPYYGVNDNGDVFQPENIDSLTDYILKQTNDSGVHFMMADGGFSVKGQQNIQEILSKQLYLCQCLVALNVVRENGHFVVKLFDLMTPFSIGLIYLMWKCFQKICVLKPNTSRPANSERYLVCKWKKPNTDSIQRHLFEVNEHLSSKSTTPDYEDILELVPMSILEEDSEFWDYIVTSNNRIGENQVIGLLKIAAYCQDANLQETRQDEIRRKCLAQWRLPDEIRKSPAVLNIETYFTNLRKDYKPQDFLTVKHNEFKSKEDLFNVFREYQDHWYFVPLEMGIDTSKTCRTFFMSRGRRDVYKYENAGWQRLSSIPVEMSPNTLIYGEIVKELEGQDKAQKIIYALHIIDGIVLGGEDIRHLPLLERNAMCTKFAKALNKPFKTDEQLAPIRCKNLIKFCDIISFFNNMEDFALKDRSVRKGFKLRNTNGRFYIPRGLLFMYELKSHLVLQYSKKTNRKYYWDKSENKSFYLEELPNKKAIFGSFRSTFQHRYFWKWEVLDQINEPHFDQYLNDLNNRSDSNLIYRADVEKIIRKNSYVN